MTAVTSFPEFTEEVEDSVLEWAVDMAESIVAALTPDGRPFGEVLKPEEQQVEEYKAIRDDPDAWAMKIRGWVAKTVQTAQAIGVQEADMASIHPYDIAQAFAYQYAEKMESLVLKHQMTAPMTGPNPFIPTAPSNEPVGVGAWQTQ